MALNLQCLKHGVDGGADSAAAWKALAELQYQNRQTQAAYDTAVSALSRPHLVSWLHAKHGIPPPPTRVLQLRP